MNRRDILRTMGAMAATATAAACADKTGSTCGIDEPQMEGPYYLALDTLRSDITEGLPGVSLRVRLVVTDAESCEPIKDAVVELWHADRDGVYSGFADQGTRGETWLRGSQVSDADGVVEFETIYPGFYEGRTAHLHLRVNGRGRAELLTQLYFPAATNGDVADEYGAAHTRNGADDLHSEGNELRTSGDPDAGLAAEGSVALWAA